MSELSERLSVGSIEVSSSDSSDEEMDEHEVVNSSTKTRNYKQREVEGRRRVFGREEEKEGIVNNRIQGAKLVQNNK